MKLKQWFQVLPFIIFWSCHIPYNIHIKSFTFNESNVFATLKYDLFRIP